jgi:hypothetical protein
VFAPPIEMTRGCSVLAQSFSATESLHCSLHHSCQLYPKAGQFKQHSELDLRSSSRKPCRKFIGTGFVANILLRVRSVIIDGVWFGNRICYTLILLLNKLYKLLSHRLMFSVCYSFH